jgi:hypothetical protein
MNWSDLKMEIMREYGTIEIIRLELVLVRLKGKENS